MKGIEREKVARKRDMDSFITKKTVATTPARMMDGKYTGFITTLRCDPSNTGNIYIGKNLQNCIYPMAAEDVQVTKVDLDKLFYYSDNGTEVMHIWGEEDK